MQNCTFQPLDKIINWLESALLKVQPREIVEFEIFDPDSDNSLGYKALIDLSQIFFCKMLTPVKKSDSTVVIRFQKLDQNDSFHKEKDLKEEKYGVGSRFFTIDKTKEPAFFHYYQQALKNVKIEDRKSVLNLGINRGDEFDVIRELLGAEEFAKKEFTGVDYCPSATGCAKERFKGENTRFHTHDINKLEELRLGRFELMISIGTLQSPGINFKKLFMELVQNYLTENGAVILGFPNCRWIDGQMIYGAKAPNYAFSEMSLVVKDIYFCKKYLQQKKFRVAITGKDYIFLTATKISRQSDT